MRKLINYKIVFVVLFLFTVVGCDSLFDEGDTEKTYDGPPQVAFFPLEREVSAGAGSTWIQVQLIGPHRTSDLSVTFSVSGTSSAVAGTHFNIASSPVVISAGTSTVNINVDLIAGSVPEGEEVSLVLDLTGANADDVIVAENLKQSRIWIAG